MAADCGQLSRPPKYSRSRCSLRRYAPILTKKSWQSQSYHTTTFCAGIVKKKWAVNSAFMAFYAFACVLICWVLWAYKASFGEQMLPFVGVPGPVVTMDNELKQALLPTSGITANFPLSTMGTPPKFYLHSSLLTPPQKKCTSSLSSQLLLWLLWPVPSSPA